MYLIRDGGRRSCGALRILFASSISIGEWRRTNEWTDGRMGCGDGWDSLLPRENVRSRWMDDDERSKDKQTDKATIRRALAWLVGWLVGGWSGVAVLLLALCFRIGYFTS